MKDSRLYLRGVKMNPNKYIEDNYECFPDSVNPKQIKGIGRGDMYRLFFKLGYKIGAEVGVQRGRNAATMLDEIPGLMLYLIDPYRNHECAGQNWDEKFLRKVKRQTHKRLRGRNVKYLQTFSEDAIRYIEKESLDFVYIDGDHTYDFVMLDIILWSRKVRRGGIVSGHDYFYKNDRQGRLPKVTAAVNHYARIHRFDPWYITDNHFPEKEKGDGYPSWFWVKK